jgi:hypothetical protein
MNFIFGLSKSGPQTYYAFQRPATILRGQYCKLGLLIFDSSWRPFVISNYTITLRLKLQDNTKVELAAVHIDNGKGEVEFELAPAQTALLMVAALQDVEVELKLTATPEEINFYTIKSGLTVLDKVF